MGELFVEDRLPGETEGRGDIQLLLALDGFDGPIDLLLSLARDQKVDLARISIVALADQYLGFVERMRKAHLELAADFLVMAAWLAYLKSRLLLPEPEPEDEPSGADMAAALTFQLQRLEAMQKVGETLMGRGLLGRDFFKRGAPEEIEIVQRNVFDCSLYDLLRAYAHIKRREESSVLHIEAADLYSVDDALKRLREILGIMPDWAVLGSFLPPGLTGLVRRSAVSATFVATLELAKQGKVVLRQDGGAFAPLYVRRGERFDTSDEQAEALS